MKKLIFLLTFTLTITMFSHNGNTEPVTDGLVSYWTFDQQDIDGKRAKDVWGKNNGTIVGNPKRVAGRVKGALEFDGSNDYVNLTNLGDFGNQLGTFTFEAWVKTSLKRERWTTLFKVREGDCIGWGIDLNARTEPPNLAVNPENRIGNLFDNISFAKDTIRFYLAYKIGERGCSTSAPPWRFPISDGEWHHLVYMNGMPYVDENGREWRGQASFVDGERIDRHIEIDRHLRRRRIIAEFDDFMPFTEPVYLGAGNNRGKAEGFYKGIIDEVRIYNRPLTEEEINQNFEIGLSVEASEKLPVLWGNLKTAK